MQERGTLAAGAAISKGATPLEALIVGEVASYAVNNWLTDKELAEKIVQRSGKNPHNRSVARCRRSLAVQGLLAIRRVLPNKRPTGASYRTSYGTTDKFPNFKALGVRDPLTQKEKAEIARRVTAIQRHDTFSPAERAGPPRLSVPPPIPPDLQKMANAAIEASENRFWKRAAKADAVMLESVSRRPPERPPDKQ